MNKIEHVAWAVRRARRKLNVMVTIRAPIGISDQKGKRVISRKVAHLGEALRRRGQAHIGITVYEKGPYLHAHHLVYVDPTNHDVLARYHDGDEIDIRPADLRAVEYITKQRRWRGDAIETQRKRRFESSGGAIPGARYSITKAAQAIADVDRASAAGPAPRAVVSSTLLPRTDVTHAPAPSSSPT